MLYSTIGLLDTMVGMVRRRSVVLDFAHCGGVTQAMVCYQSATGVLRLYNYAHAGCSVDGRQMYR